jgi:hypothetical protein
MNTLLLSNSAPYASFFNALSKKIIQDGQEVSIAVDCNYSKKENNLLQLGLPIYEFSLFFSKHKRDYGILERYKKYNLNAALLSDFERAEVYKLWDKHDINFFEDLKSALLSFFENIIQHKKIDVVLYEFVSNTFAHFALFVCQENGITYRGLTSSRLPGRFSISSDPLKDHKLIEDKLLQIQQNVDLVDQETRQWCENYLDNIENITPDYMKFNNLDNVDLGNKYFNLEKLKKIIKLLGYINNHDDYHAFQYGNPANHSWQQLKRSIFRKLKIVIIDKFYQIPPKKERFLLYPLHFHPEASTSILCGTYLNEYEVIKNIAFNLPQGFMLYVKDHMSAYGYPTLDFYRSINSLPNVRLLAPNAATKELIKASEAVITLTSTVGYEALLLNKRVFLFGHVFYEFHPDVIKIVNPANLFELFSKELGCNAKAGRAYNLDFLAAYYLTTKPGILNMMLNESESKKIVDELFPLIQ